ncbi:DUF4123 domain-containing protein [Pseudomonas tolaasii]|uniref:DUF4123 domain-containing protein n=2 Tax=Pseudomonas tolaasii TaxID=29442 RepID=A0A7Y8AS31_PSETO|nr:DUF4123 domain-containing protein [Pseudomonas tolaasii]ARB30817.1 hypothetical protein B5P22_27110 [Pseudomonas tolaasii]KAB0467201.1 DUF4123 domain-containing protein [Pseudomonas tolaasii]MBY8943159.1 DUF4123 domain-containing protein [Pseudomonas tolaasii]NWC20162.1 DUF4123 domain-containing protein [Pseudomonas tolaasii]NWC43540.1 DUF4123 domain-containing protein [Pseudomonas tolaasii]
MESMPNRWMAQQQQAGRRLCLILEGQHEACNPLLAARSLSQHCSVYRETALAELAADGPVIVLLDRLDEPALVDLLQHPEGNWGWLGSLPDDDLSCVVRHWRERLLVGPQGSQAMYRFHDNRTLARALAHLPREHWPTFLGPLVSVCYWREGDWCQGENPAPGEYPVPVPAPWLTTPNPQASAILQANVLRFLLTEHSESLAALVEFQDPRIWLSQVLEQARIWQWCGPQQLEFLVVRRLEEATGNCAIQWQPMPDESAKEHFERVLEHWRRAGGKHE